MKIRKILITGVFFRDKSNNLPTVAEELEHIFFLNGFSVMICSTQRNKLLRIFDTIYTMVWYHKYYNTVLIQFYGSLTIILEILIILLSKLLRKKTVITLHGGSLPSKFAKYPVFFKTILRMGDTITCPSNFIKSHLDKLGINSIIVYNPLRLDQYHYNFKAALRPKLFWMRSYLNSVYNPKLAVDVMSILIEQYPNAEMIMAGKDMGDKGDVVNYIKKKNLEKAIIVKDVISDSEKNEIAANYDIYLCTNLIDNAPVSFIEMMSLGLPIVSTNIGGIPYFVKDGETALLAPVDAKPLANNIINLIEDPNLANKISQRAYSFSRNFSHKTVLNEWKKIIPIN